MLFLRAVLAADGDVVRGSALNLTVMLRKYAYTGVNGCLGFHACSYGRCLAPQERNCLTLHVRAHQSTVRVIVLKERDKSGRHREYHLRRNVHQINLGLLIL